ncbi:MAG: class I SAM-dependent methyltransferase [Deltaproteobacteria bacterium]|nr:class I SAM-dependent methyltransferase [Deltaproteobacteria bacterium]
MGFSLNLTADCWKNVHYRGPHHPIAEAFVSPKLDFIRRRIRLTETALILDMGCGTGVFTHYLSQLAPTVGSDLSRVMLGKNPHDRLVQCDALATPFKPGRFDLVFEANLLHHVKDPLSVLKEMKRVSRRYVVSLEPNMYNPFMFANCLLMPHERGALKFTPGYMSRCFLKTGLTLIDQVSMGMIFQNKTPMALLPVLKRLDRPAPWGGYILSIGKKRT